MSTPARPTQRFSPLALALLALCTASPAAGLQAWVDRHELALGEIVELNLQSDEAALFGRPDLSVLEEHFEVLDTRLLTHIGDAQNPGTRSSRLVIGLQPRQAGRLSIPPLQIGTEHSPAIELQVGAAAQPDADNRLAPVFIDASLDQPRVYVQAQAILTLRVYHSLALYDDARLSPLEAENIRVEALGSARSYETLIDGVRHGVIESRYALFPQQSGELQIPSLLFSATTPGQADDSAGEQPFTPRRGRSIEVRSPRLQLQVLPRPAEYPADRPWLPARQLQLSEQWSPQGSTLHIGDSLTRSLHLRAEGLAGEQLPQLDSQELPAALRRYPEQPQLDNRHDAGGLIGSREESSALVPTVTGRIELPAVEVVWWSTQEDRLMRSQLPARTLQIAENPTLHREATSIQPGSTIVQPPPLWPWQLASGALALSTLLGFSLWWRARRLPAVIRAAAASGPSPRTLKDDLRRACQSNDPHSTRQALDAWARQQPETLADLTARYVPLSDALDELNGALYSENSQSWQGERLWQAIDGLPPSQEQPDSNDNGSLPPLYPR